MKSGKTHGMSGSDVRPNHRAQRNASIAGLRGGQNREEGELVPFGNAPAGDHHRGKDRESPIERRSLWSDEVNACGFQRGALEPGERGTQLFVRSAVDAPADGAKKRMEGEGD